MLIVILLGVLGVIALALWGPDLAYAQSVAPSELGIDEGAEAAKGNDQVTDLFGETGVFRTITNVMLFLIGAISVIMLMIGGIWYIVSGGDATRVQEAKNTILYAIVGIIVTLLAYAAIDFVIDAFTQRSV